MFVFDEAFDHNATNLQIYQRTAKSLVNFTLNAGKATCFAYGQTGSGKTYTMMGPGGGKQQQDGLYALAAADIFAQVSGASITAAIVRASYARQTGG